MPFLRQDVTQCDLPDTFMELITYSRYLILCIVRKKFYKSAPLPPYMCIKSEKIKKNRFFGHFLDIEYKRTNDKV